MPVAKSYQSLNLLGEPYIKNKRMYILVETKSGKEKEVRWYTDQEYAKMYPEEKKDKTKDPYYKSQKYVLGFDEGYIWILKNPTEENEEWLYLNGYLYSTGLWGRYIKSTEKVEVPYHIEMVKLYWEDVGKADEWLKDEAEVLRAVDKVRYGERLGEWVGAVGDRLDLKLKVLRRSKKESYYGEQFTHDFEGEDGNQYRWITGARSLTPGEEYELRGTIKEHISDGGVKITVLTRCRVAES